MSGARSDTPSAPATATAIAESSHPQSANPGPAVGLLTGITAVAAGQLARVRVARVPLLFVATVQSVGILVLLRAVVSRGDVTTGAPVVAGSTVLVVAFVALNLLAQRFGALRAARALDYYAALPVPPAAVVLGTAAAYAAFTIPGSLVTAVVGSVLYGLPLSHLAVAVPAVLTASLALAGVGAVAGLVMPRPELATVAGQLGMTAVLFLGIVAPAHLPVGLRGVRLAVPGMLAVDALADALHAHPSWSDVVIRLVAQTGYGIVALAVAGRTLRRVVSR
jgi:ABC-2 type transport system permease protein